MDWLDRNEWPFEPHFHDGPDGRQHYVDVGEGPVTLFSHGTPTWSYEWRHAIAALPGRRIAIDHLGFGLSDRPDVGYRPEDHARRFAHFADSLDLQDATMVVHDYGGPIALRWILDHVDRVKRVVIVNTFAWPLDDDWQIAMGARLLGSGLGRWMYGRFNLSLNAIAPSAYADRAKWDAVKDQYHSVFPDYDSRTRTLWPLAHALLGSSEYYADLQRDLPRLAGTPVDLVWGAKDTAFPPHVADKWQAAVPHAQRVDLPVGHWPHEEDPAGFLAAL